MTHTKKIIYFQGRFNIMEWYSEANSVNEVVIPPQKKKSRGIKIYIFTSGPIFSTQISQEIYI